MSDRTLPHLFVNRPPLRCCLDCAGQTRLPYPAPMIHESTCGQVRSVKTWAPPADWKLVWAVRNVELAEDPDTLYDAHEALYAAAKEVTTRA